MTNAVVAGAISRTEAEQAIHSLMAGEPPSPEIIRFLSVGLERDLKTWHREFLSEDSFIACPETRGSSFKMVEAYYGGGKTHYLRAVESLALEQGFATSFVGLKKDECPLTRFDLIYTAVCTSLTVMTPLGRVRGIGEILRTWVKEAVEEADDPYDVLRTKLSEVRDLPLMSIKVALRLAAEAIVAGDDDFLEEALVYLQGGKIGPNLRRGGVLESVGKANGSLALRSIAGWLCDVGYTGFVLILDEGDRSLSLATAKDRKGASNNLVQLINETAMDGAWPSTLLLYSIPSWDAFQEAFGRNQALISRVRATGFPMVPPATRIELDSRYADDDAKQEFCKALGQRLFSLYQVRTPNSALDEDVAAGLAEEVARSVTEREFTGAFRRLFVQSYISTLFTAEAEDPGCVDIVSIVDRCAREVSGVA